MENKIEHKPVHEYSRIELADILTNLDREKHPEFYEEVKTELYWRNNEPAERGKIRYDEIPDLGIARFFKKLFRKKEKPQ